MDKVAEMIKMTKLEILNEARGAIYHLLQLKMEGIQMMDSKRN